MKEGSKPRALRNAHRVLVKIRPAGAEYIKQYQIEDLTEQRRNSPSSYPKCLKQQLKSSVERTNRLPRKRSLMHQDQIQIRYSIPQDSVNTSSKILQRLKSQFLTFSEEFYRL